MSIGIGARPSANSVSVRWPSGRTQNLGAIQAGSLITVYEDPAMSPSGEATQVEKYVTPNQASSGDTIASTPTKRPRIELASAKLDSSESKLTMLTTMATWCAACREEVPELVRLRSIFGDDELRMLGVPVDEKESADLLQSYENKSQLPYDLLSSIPAEEREAVKAHLEEILVIEALPSTIVLDADGNVLLTQHGAPTVSKLHALLGEL